MISQVDPCAETKLPLGPQGIGPIEARTGIVTGLSWMSHRAISLGTLKLKYISAGHRFLAAHAAKKSATVVMTAT